MISVLDLLIFIPAFKIASENRSSAYWRSLLLKLNNAKSSANSRCQTLHSANVTPLLEDLSLFILSMYIMNRKKERTQLCYSSTLTLKCFVFMSLTRTQTSDCLYNNLIAADSWPLASYSSSTVHSLSPGIRSYAFSRSTKHVYTFSTYFHDFSKICWRDLVHGGFARMKSALCIQKLRFDYFMAFLFEALCIEFSRKT